MLTPGQLALILTQQYHVSGRMATAAPVLSNWYNSAMIWTTNIWHLRQMPWPSSSAFPALSLGFTILGEISAYVAFFKSNHRGSHIPPLRMLHTGCVLVAGIHPSRTRMSGSFESVRWNTCVRKLGLGLYSDPREFWGNGVRTHANFKEKNSLYRKLRRLNL